MEVYPNLLKNSLAFKADGSINRRAVLNFWRGNTMETFEGEYNKIANTPVSNKYVDKTGTKPRKITVHDSLYGQYKKYQYTLSLLCLESNCINPSFLKKVRAKVSLDQSSTSEYSYTILIIKDIETVQEKLDELKRKSRELTRAERDAAAAAAAAAATEHSSDAETVVDDWEALA